MSKNRLIFILWIIVLLLFYIFTGNLAPLLGLLGTLIIWIVSVLWAVMVRRKVQVFVNLQGSLGNEFVSLCEIKLSSQKVLYFAMVFAELEYANCLTLDRINIKCKVPNTVKVESQFCGKVQVYLKKVIVSDIFGVLRLKVENTLEPKYVALMIPEIYQIDCSQQLVKLMDVDGITYSETVAGSDPSETFEIREYKPGDRVKGIHWKLSNKLDQIMYKESSFPLKNSMLILMETSFNQNGDILKRTSNDVVTSTISLSESLLDMGINHHIGWMNYEENRFILHQINTSDNLIGVIGFILGTPFVSGNEQVKEKYYKECGECQFPHMAIIDGKIENELKLYN